jgi:hypothetical protein
MVSSQLNQTKTGSNRPVLVWFGFFRTKTGSTCLARFFPVWFYFLVWLGFFWFDSVFFPVWIRFIVFGFRFIKLKPNRTSRFFQKFNRFNRFFSWFGFFSFFFNFLSLISFLIFFANLYFTQIKKNST